MEISDIILLVFIHGLVFGVVCYYIGAQREIGALAGGLLGLVLGTIGLIIVLFSRRKESVDFTDLLQKYKSLFDSGTITENEFNTLKGRLLQQQ
jgi:hypothetical protein